VSRKNFGGYFLISGRLTERSIWPSCSASNAPMPADGNVDRIVRIEGTKARSIAKTRPSSERTMAQFLDFSALPRAVV